MFPLVVLSYKVLIVLDEGTDPWRMSPETLAGSLSDVSSSCLKLPSEIKTDTSTYKAIVKANIVMRSSADILLIAGSNLHAIKEMLATRLKETTAVTK